MPTRTWGNNESKMHFFTVFCVVCGMLLSCIWTPPPTLVFLALTFAQHLHLAVSLADFIWVPCSGILHGLVIKDLWGTRFEIMPLIHDLLISPVVLMMNARPLCYVNITQPELSPIFWVIYEILLGHICMRTPVHFFLGNSIKEHKSKQDFFSFTCKYGLILISPFLPLLKAYLHTPPPKR